MMSKPVFYYTFLLRSPRLAIFADIIKIVTMFIRKVVKIQKHAKIVKNNWKIKKQNLICICIS